MAIICRLIMDGGSPCNERLKDWLAYAKHILKHHKDDEARTTWARDAIAAKDEAVTPEAKKTWRGKPIEAIPVARRDAVPTHIRERLEIADREHAPKGFKKGAKGKASTEATE